MNNYEQKQEQRRIRYNELASKAREEASTAGKNASDVLALIPPGQPILIGHHSESRHRSDLEKVHASFTRSSMLDKKAEHYDHKADSVGTGGISADDPDAIAKLEKELASLQKAGMVMKAANKIIRSGKHEELKGLGFSEEAIRNLTKPNCVGQFGFAAYSISNNRANASRISKRIDILKKAGSRTFKEESGKGYVYREDPNENRLMFVFDGKPAPDIYSLLKSRAFKWSPSRGAWVRQWTSNAAYSARDIRRALDADD